VNPGHLRRTVSTSAAVLATAGVLVGAATPAFAEAVGRAGGAGMGFGEILLVYVGAPVALFLLLTVLALAPSARRRPRYRPGRPFDGEPVWFAGPDDVDSAVRGAKPADQDRGGARGSW